MNNSTQVFYELVRAGLWEKDARLISYGEVDYQEVMRLAEEQSVMGLVVAGMECVSDTKIPKQDLLPFIGQTLQIEEQNKAMNRFIASIIETMRKKEAIYTLLIKGQGVAQCYERPLWRTSGDIDLYLSNDNYKKAKVFLSPLATIIEPEDKRRLHFGVTIDSWVVELHGTMHTGISRKMNEVSDEVYKDIFYDCNVRSWNNNGTTVFLPEANSDVIIIFNHFLSHFYGEGIGLRQICDWCRLLWTYRDTLNYNLLKTRIKKMGLMSEWKVFGAFSVEYLGMPKEAMPFYEDSALLSQKARKLSNLIIETGGFRANHDESYRKSFSKMKSNIVTFQTRIKGFAKIATVFPVNAPRFFINYVFDRMSVVL